MKKFTLLWLLIFCFSPFLNAQFEVVGSEEYGRIFGVTYDRTTENKLYAITLGNHILSSDDNGQSWSVFYAISEGTFISVQDNLKAFHNDKLTYYIKTGSFTGSRTVYVLDIETREILHQYTPPMPDSNANDVWISSYDISESDPNYAIVSVGYSIGFANFEKVFYTTDTGNSWEQVYYTEDNANISTGAVALNPDNPEKLFITLGNGDSGLDGGLLISEDGGETWTEKIEGIVLEPIAFHPENSDEIWVGTGISFGMYPENLYKSTDGGLNWEIVPIGWSNYLLDNINSIEFNPSNPSNMIVLEDNEVVISNDGGETWEIYVYEDASDNPDEYYYGLNASFNPFDADEVFISGNYYPLFSTDKGVTMERIKTPYFLADGEVHYFSNGTEEHLYYGVQNGFVHKDMQTEAEEGYNILPINYVTINSGTAVRLDDNLAGRVYIYSGGFTGSNLYRSDDHGATQLPIYSNFANSLDALAPVPGTNTKIWTAFSSFGDNPEMMEIDFSDMNSIQVNPVAVPPSPGVLTALLFPDENPQHLIGVKGSRVHETVNAGATWMEISNGLETLDENNDMIFKLAQNPLNAQQFTIASNKGMFTTLDSGQNWSQLSGIPVHNIRHSSENEDHLIAATHTSENSSLSLIYSKDGGGSWETIVDEVYMPFQSGNVTSSTDFHFYDDFADIFVGTAGLGMLKYTLDLRTMAIHEPEVLENEIRVYPNPATDIVHISAKEKVVRVNVFTMNGRKVMSTTDDNVNISHLGKGIYVLQVQLESGEIQVEKIIKK